MVNVPINFKFLGGFDFFNVVLPALKLSDDKLFLRFATISTFFAYEKSLIKLLNEIRIDDAVLKNIYVLHRIKFIEELVIELMRYNFKGAMKI
jgi:hypothetical protein